MTITGTHCMGGGASAALAKAFIRIICPKGLSLAILATYEGQSFGYVWVYFIALITSTFSLLAGIRKKGIFPEQENA